MGLFSEQIFLCVRWINNRSTACDSFSPVSQNLMRGRIRMLLGCTVDDLP